MRVSPVACEPIPAKIPSATLDFQIHERKPVDAGHKKTAVSSGFFDQSGLLRKNKWCPEED
jgi:hypothetical protein